MPVFNPNTKLAAIERLKLGATEAACEWMEHRNMNQRAVAKKAGVSTAFVSEWLSGKKDNVSLEWLASVAWALGCDVEIVFKKRTNPREVE